MIKKSGISFFALMVCIVSNYAVEPDFIRTTVFDVDSNGNDLVSAVYSGLGREVQSKFKIGNDKDRVISTFYDELNRKKITTRPFLDSVYEGKYLPGSFYPINDYLKKTYRQYDTVGGDPFAYSEVEYYKDMSGRVKRSGAPGIKNRIGSGYETGTWYYGVNLSTANLVFPQGNILFKNGFISTLNTNTGFDTVDLFDTLYSYLLEKDSILSPRTHFLTINMEPLGSFCQKLDDDLGRTVCTWSDPGSSAGDEIITSNRYDFYGNVLEEFAPANYLNPADTLLLESTKYLYNTLGNMIKKETPDGAIDTFLYDSKGLLKQIKTYSVVSGRAPFEDCYFTYDKYGRNISTRITREGQVVHQTFNYYDNVERLKIDEKTLGIPSGILSRLENLCGKIVCSAALNYIDYSTYTVVDLNSYNDDGEISVKYKIVPGLPVQEITYDYDIHGKILNEKLTCGRDTIIKGYVYDSYGRLNKIIHKNNGGKELVKFTYNELGKTTLKSLDSIHEIEYEYTIQDQIKKIQSKGPLGFKEEISYLQNSNIDTAKIKYNGIIPDSLINDYRYDNVNRLVAVNSSKPEFNSSYAYDQAGRFRSKEEGTSVISNYAYHQKTNRLKYAKDYLRDYVYDQRGNLIVDRFKNLVIQYNGQNMPVQFKFYKSIPSEIKTDPRGTVQISDSLFTGNLYQYMDKKSDTDINCKLIAKVTMLYDASGNRVLKMENIQ